MIKTLACHKAEPTVLSNHAVNSDNTTMNKAQWPANWRSTRSWTLNLYPPAWREAASSATRPGSVASGTALTRPRLAGDVFDVQRATAQPFDVEAQVAGLGRVAGGVSGHGRYHRHRRAVADHGHGQRATQGMHPARLAGRELDPRAGRVARQAAGDRRGAAERVEGMAALDEHLRAVGFGAAVPDVVDDRPADVVQQRQAQRPARLVLDDREGFRPPV